MRNVFPDPRNGVIIIRLFHFCCGRTGISGRKGANERFERAISMKFEIKDITLKSTLERLGGALISASNMKRGGRT